MRLRLVGAALLLAVGATACSDLPERPGGLSRRQTVAHDDAVLHALAARLAARPGVQCLSAQVSDGGTGVDLPGTVSVTGAVRGLTRSEREALAREIGREVWLAPLAGGVSTLSVFVGEVTAPPGPGGGTDLGRLLGRGDGGSVDSQELAAAYGPGPTSTALSSAPPDPGGPTSC
ncbi:MAG: hypothetical protein JWM64_1742 [Frankiales bacterium]|nr:hypothetical protein [Frankiales bacterium]